MRSTLSSPVAASVWSMRASSWASGSPPSELYSTARKRSWQKPLLPNSAATLPMLSPEPNVPWMKTMGRWLLSQSASLTTTGQLVTALDVLGLVSPLPHAAASAERHPKIAFRLLMETPPRRTDQPVIDQWL